MRRDVAFEPHSAYSRLLRLTAAVGLKAATRREPPISRSQRPASTHAGSSPCKCIPAVPTCRKHRARNHSRVAATKNARRRERPPKGSAIVGGSASFASLAHFLFGPVLLQPSGRKSAIGRGESRSLSIRPS